MTSVQEINYKLPPPLSMNLIQDDIFFSPPPPPRRRLSFCWTDVVHSTVNSFNSPVEPAILRSEQADNIIHPDIKHVIIRSRGSYWWEYSQAKLEEQFSNGMHQPITGGFYVFLEEEQSSDIIVRYGNILMGTYWVMQTVAFPKGHPDADIPPYQMIDATIKTDI